MAFENKYMSVIAYANGFTFWHYQANEPIEHVLGKGYFNHISSVCESGDVIYIVHCGNLYLRSIKKKDGEIILQNPK